ncbi:hypothetical protein PS870_06550 [Pseudomonas fluorescens]|uniref:Uncharacterized protein n=1 Tax=Pseudomonas fluorescens TaxID=294 RepID=A0A5E7QL55_PSEFL|nr:hypothetical protein PS870_06550 [Pseudomonas fluorescens]
MRLNSDSSFSWSAPPVMAALTAPLDCTPSMAAPSVIRLPTGVLLASPVVSACTCTISVPPGVTVAVCRTVKVTESERTICVPLLTITPAVPRKVTSPSAAVAVLR